jgi:hypothetical protein
VRGRFVEEARELQAASSQREREALQAQDTAQRRARALEEEVRLASLVNSHVVERPCREPLEAIRRD